MSFFASLLLHSCPELGVTLQWVPSEGLQNGAMIKFIRVCTRATMRSDSQAAAVMSIVVCSGSDLSHITQSIQWGPEGDPYPDKKLPVPSKKRRPRWSGRRQQAWLLFLFSHNKFYSIIQHKKCWDNRTVTKKARWGPCASGDHGRIYLLQVNECLCVQGWLGGVGVVVEVKWQLSLKDCSLCEVPTGNKQRLFASSKEMKQFVPWMHKCKLLKEHSLYIAFWLVKY